MPSRNDVDDSEAIPIPCATDPDMLRTRSLISRILWDTYIIVPRWRWCQKENRLRINNNTYLHINTFELYIKRQEWHIPKFPDFTFTNIKKFPLKLLIPRKSLFPYLYKQSLLTEKIKSTEKLQKFLIMPCHNQSPIYLTHAGKECSQLIIIMVMVKIISILKLHR